MSARTYTDSDLELRLIPLRNSKRFAIHIERFSFYKIGKISAVLNWNLYYNMVWLVRWHD